MGNGCVHPAGAAVCAGRGSHAVRAACGTDVPDGCRRISAAAPLRRIERAADGTGCPAACQSVRDRKRGPAAFIRVHARSYSVRREAAACTRKAVCRCAETRAQGACGHHERTQLHGLRYDIYSTDSADLVRRGVRAVAHQQPDDGRRDLALLCGRVRAVCCSSRLSGACADARRTGASAHKLSALVSEYHRGPRLRHAAPEQHLRSGGARHRVRGAARVADCWKARQMESRAAVSGGGADRLMYCRGAAPERPVYGDVSAVRQRSGHSAERHRTRDAHRLRQLPERCASGTRVAALEWSEAAGYGRADRGRSGTCAQPAGADGNGRGWGTAHARRLSGAQNQR